MEVHFMGLAAHFFHRFEYDDLSIPDPGSDAPPHYKHFFNNEARLVVGSDLPRRSLSIAKEVRTTLT
jgi:hypothetical protein